MSELKLTVRAGWRDQHPEPVPQFVADHIDRKRSLGNPGPPILVAFLPGQSPDVTELEGPRLSHVLDNAGWFLTQLRNPEVRSAELIFVNPSAQKPHPNAPVIDRPVPIEVTGDGLVAVEVFVNKVADSIHPGGTHGAWASCEWASLKIEK